MDWPSPPPKGTSPIMSPTEADMGARARVPRGGPDPGSACTAGESGTRWHVTWTAAAIEPWPHALHTWSSASIVLARAPLYQLLVDRARRLHLAGVASISGGTATSPPRKRDALRQALSSRPFRSSGNASPDVDSRHVALLGGRADESSDPCHEEPSWPRDAASTRRPGGAVRERGLHHA